MMKKLIALLLALSLVFSLAIAVSADETTVTEPVLKKKYEITGGDTFPAETVKFTVTASNKNPDDTIMLSVADLEVTGAENVLEVTVPTTYTKVGKYIYTITEDPGNTAGVTYSDDSITVGVLVSYDANQQLVTQLYPANPEDGSAKNDTFTNNYDLGSLKVKKTVEGNLGSKSAEFDMTVTFTSAKPVLSEITYEDSGVTKTLTFTESNGTYTAVANITLIHNETVSFSDIPAGVTYKVEEDAKHLEGAGNPNTADDAGYTVEYTNNGEGTAAQSSDETITVTNTKETVVDTGIALDSMPYVLLLTVAVLGMAALAGKKRYEV